MTIFSNSAIPAKDRDILFPADKGRGLNFGRRPRGFAYAGTAHPFPVNLIVPRSEWQARIAEIEATKSSIPDLCDQAGLPVKDQEQTNFCWANGPTHCVEILRVLEGLAPTVLSAASVACQVNGYLNEGGWGLDALKWIIAHGIVTDAAWPNAVISRQFATPANLATATKFTATAWWELDPRNVDQLISCLLLGVPVAVGYSWWSHEVTAVKPLWLDGAIAIEVDNSWGQGWGTNGRATLQGDLMIPDDAVAPCVATAA